MVSLVKNVVSWGSSHRTKQPVVVDLCEICGKKPKFIENGHKHPYCSRSCARNGGGPSPTVCILQGCRSTGKPAFANFCSEVHAREGVRLGQVDKCELCEVQPRTVGTMCIPCDRVVRVEPQLRELSSGSTTYKNLRAQFLSEWESPGSSPSFEKAFEIILPRDVRLRHEQYRQANPTLEEIRTFHSSQCICDLGTKEPTLCNFKSCGICSIVKSCFKSFAFGASYNNGRFGEGVYSYRNPALADRFATSCTSSPYRVMIACDIAVESNNAGVNNDTDEESLFVPTADGILPVHIIIYATK
uniref:PARP catalytic domain-containing protein n=1 Tax=Psilocybe cubensis TaxID=181762 RepID=A0A8H7Y2D8_PSICU